MSTPGYTALASLGRVLGHRQDRYAPAARTVPAPSHAVEAAAGIEVYGNWCGPGHTGPGTPVDAVDEVCCRHDQCYCERGELDCSCDRDLIRRMPAAVADPGTSAKGRAVGAAAAALFAADPFCLCHRICGPIPFPPFWDCTGAPFPVPGIPGPAKLCPFPYA